MNTPTRSLPIVAFSSLSASLDYFNELGGAPTEIHSSVFPKEKFSGSTIALLVKAYRQLGLAKESGATEASAVEVLVNPDTRTDALGDLLRKHYGSLIDLPIGSANPNQFNKWFDEFNMNGEDARKAKTFFLHAARAAGITVSPFIVNKYKTRSGKSASAKPRPKPSDTPSAFSTSSVAKNARRKKKINQAQGETKTVVLRNGIGSVTVQIDVAAMDILELDEGDEKTLIYGLMGLLKKYEQGPAISRAPSETEIVTS